jgi:predicted metal-dependent phosphotriesterase family hydrolase
MRPQASLYLEIQIFSVKTLQPFDVPLLTSAYFFSIGRQCIEKIQKIKTCRNIFLSKYQLIADTVCTRTDDGIVAAVQMYFKLKKDVYDRTDNEKKVLRATAAAQTETGAPVIIHPGRHPTAPAEVIRILQEAGGDISRTVMSHLDRT